MRNLPIISIITPSYNQGEFLEECIKSVLSQSYENFEFIIIDGGSTDNSVEIIKSYEKHLTYWVSEKDDGQSDAINKGFKLATGEIVAWINSDDFYYQGAFECIKNQYMENPYASFYFGNGNRVDLNGKLKSKFYAEGTPDFNLDALVYGLNYILQPVTFMNHVSLKEVGYLDKMLHYGMDSDLWLKLAKQRPPQKVEQVLAATREYDNTKTSTGSFERAEELRLISYKYSNCPITPGALLYYLDTLNNYLNDSKSPFQPWFKSDLILFWEVAAENLQAFNAGVDGTPLLCSDEEPSNGSSDQSRVSLSGRIQQLKDTLDLENRKFEEASKELSKLKNNLFIRMLIKLKLA